MAITSSVRYISLLHAARVRSEILRPPGRFSPLPVRQACKAPRLAGLSKVKAPYYSTTLLFYYSVRTYLAQYCTQYVLLQ